MRRRNEIFKSNQGALAALEHGHEAQPAGRAAILWREPKPPSPEPIEGGEPSQRQRVVWREPAPPTSFEPLEEGEGEAAAAEEVGPSGRQVPLAPLQPSDSLNAARNMVLRQWRPKVAPKKVVADIAPAGHNPFGGTFGGWGLGSNPLGTPPAMQQAPGAAK